MRPAAVLASWALLLNFVWEMAQGGLFVGMAARPWLEATLICLRAAAGDALIILLAYGAVALGTSDGRWLFRAQAGRVAAFAAVSAICALWLERYSLGLGRWQYRPQMPVDPLFGLGLAVWLQWTLLPVLSLAAARRSAFAGRGAGIRLTGKSRSE